MPVLSRCSAHTTQPTSRLNSHTRHSYTGCAGTYIHTYGAPAIYMRCPIHDSKRMPIRNPPPSHSPLSMYDFIPPLPHRHSTQSPQPSAHSGSDGILGTVLQHHRIGYGGAFWLAGWCGRHFIHSFIHSSSVGTDRPTEDRPTDRRPTDRPTDRRADPRRGVMLP